MQIYSKLREVFICSNTKGVHVCIDILVLSLKGRFTTKYLKISKPDSGKHVHLILDAVIIAVWFFFLQRRNGWFYN